MKLRETHTYESIKTGGQRAKRETERSGEGKKKEKNGKKNMNRATCTGRDLSAEKVCGLDFCQ